MVRLDARLKGLPHVSGWLLGCAFARAWLGLAISQSREADALLDSPGAGHALIIAGELAGFLACALLTRGGGAQALRRRASGAFLACALVGSLAVAASLSPVASAAPWRAPACAAGSMLCGFGYATGLMLWVEAFGTLAPGGMVLAWSGSYLANFLIWSLTQGAGAAEAAVLMAALPTLSLAFLAPASAAAEAASGACPGKRSGQAGAGGVPWLLVLWVAAFGFMYGLGDSATGLAFSTLPARVGMAVPAAVALLGVTFGARRFDMHVLLAVSVGGMALGMLAVFVLGAPDVLAQVLMSAANEAYLMFAYAFACSVAYRTGASAARTGGLIGGANVAMLQAGAWAGSALAPLMASERAAQALVGAIGVALALLVTLAAVYNRDYLDSFSLNGDDPAEAGPLAAARAAGLSPRETAVLLPLCQGLSLSQIADELFLAPGTVRAHVGSIYRKMGVHSRAELLERVGELAGEER